MQLLDDMTSTMEAVHVEDADQKPHVCSTCYQIFDSQQLLKIHDQLCSEKPPEPMHNYGYNLYAEHTAEKPHLCGTCNLAFECEGKFKEHKLTCNGSTLSFHAEEDSSVELGSAGIKLYHYSTCQIPFHTAELWRNHTVSCSEKKPFVCDICQLGFSQENEIIQHNEKHVCGIGRTITTETSTNFQEDNIASNGDILHKCDQCGKSFSSTFKLNRHVKRHSVEKLHKCEKCNASFGTKQCLARHNLIHSGERPFHCDQCDKSFIRKDQFKKHKETHSKGRYHCDQCDAILIENRP